MYMAMLLSNWGSSQQASETQSDESIAYDLSTESMWIKFITQWITCILYLWSIMAPVLWTSRDWS
jgi:hypothetical protein